MDDSDIKKEAKPATLFLERRRNRQADLSSAEVMRILRLRAAAQAKGSPDSETRET